MSTEQPIHRRPGGTLYRYIAREMVFPTLFALGGLTLVVLTKNVLGYSELVINRGLGLSAVSWIAFYQVIPLMAQMTPFAVLVGCLVALGRLGADRELLILEASGLSVRRLVGPVVAFTAAMSLVALGLTVLAAPWANNSLDEAFAKVAEQSPAALVRAGAVQELGDWKLEARQVSPSGTKLEGIVAWIPSIRETVFAEKGVLGTTPENDAELVLENGVVVIDPRRRPRQVRFDSMTVELPADRGDFERDEADKFASMSLPKLYRALKRLERETSGRSTDARVELHRRFALPLAALVFGVLVLPLFLARAQFSRAGGGILGLAATLVYYGLVQLGNGMIQSGMVQVPIGVWLPDLVLGAGAIVLFLRAGRQSSFGRHLGRPQSAERSWTQRLFGGGDTTDKAVLSEESASAGSAPAVLSEESANTGSAAVEPRIRVRRFALQRYIASRFLQMLAICFGVALTAYLLVDVLERLSWFTKYDATATEVARFYGARIPLLASRVVPMSLLVATSLTVGLLAVQGELMGIRSCGIAAPHALLPILFVCAIVVPVSFLLNNNIVPRSNALADYLKQTEIKGDGRGPRSIEEVAGQEIEEEQEESNDPPPVWYRAGDHFYEATRLDPQLGRAREVTVYQLGPDGLPFSRADARAARHIGGGVWRLVDPVRLELGDESILEVPAEPFADLGEDVPAEVDTMHLSVGELMDEIEEVEASGYDATHYAVDLVVKVISPLACLVLPALALFFCVSGPPYPSSALSLVLSAGVAIVYVLSTGVFVSLGYGGAVPPWVAGAGPTAIFGVLALFFGLRLRGFGQTF